MLILDKYPLKLKCSNFLAWNEISIRKEKKHDCLCSYIYLQSQFIPCQVIIELHYLE